MFMEVHYVLEEGGETFIIKITPSFRKSAKIRKSSYHRARGLVCPCGFFVGVFSSSQ